MSDRRIPKDWIWHCRSCGAPVLTAYSVNGKRMTIYAANVSYGNLCLDMVEDERTGDKYLRAINVGPPEPTEQIPLLEYDESVRPRFIDHHTNCEYAEEWR